MEVRIYSDWKLRVNNDFPSDWEQQNNDWFSNVSGKNINIFDKNLNINFLVGYYYLFSITGIKEKSLQETRLIIRHNLNF